MTDFQLDEQAIRALITGPDGPVVRHVTDVSRQATNLAKAECPVDTGNLRARHEFTVDVEGDKVVGTIGSTADYGLYVHEGGKTRVTHGKQAVTVTRHGNPWLERALRRLGLTLVRE